MADFPQMLLGISNFTKMFSASSTFYEVQAASTKFGLHAGNMKFNTQNKNKYMYNYMHNFTTLFV